MNGATASMAATKTTKTTTKTIKPAAKKPAAKKAPATKAAPKKAAAKPVVKKAAPAKKAAAPAKKPAVKKPAAAAKAPAKKAPVKKAAPKKATTTAKVAPKAAPKSAPKAAPKAAKITDPIKALALGLEKTLDMNTAKEIITIDLKGRSSLADWMIVASGGSARQVAALANYVQHEFAKQGYKRLRVEGLPQADWVVVDSGDVVVHLFRPEVREFYQLEKLWDADETEPTKRISLR